MIELPETCKKNAAYLFLLRILYSPRHLLKLFKLKNYMNIKTLYLDKNGPISICFNVRYWCRILSAKARLWGTRCGFLIKTNRAKIKSSHVLLIFQCNIFVFCNFLFGIAMVKHCAVAVCRDGGAKTNINKLKMTI